jgi:nicotinate-nucleotide pyrophosphorylase (carboxylating)
MILIKDNHISVAGGITKAVNAIRPLIQQGIKIEVETTTLEEVKEALSNEVDIIMLDNMDNETMRAAVTLIDGKAKVEASGNMTLERVREVASTGVDYISIGALTHSVVAFDISQKIK